MKKVNKKCYNDRIIFELFDMNGVLLGRNFVKGGKGALSWTKLNPVEIIKEFHCKDYDEIEYTIDF